MKGHSMAKHSDQKWGKAGDTQGQNILFAS